MDTWVRVAVEWGGTEVKVVVVLKSPVPHVIPMPSNTTTGDPESSGGCPRPGGRRGVQSVCATASRHHRASMVCMGDVGNGVDALQAGSIAAGAGDIGCGGRTAGAAVLASTS